MAKPGDKIKCRECGKLATITLFSGRLRVYCPWHQGEYLLKEQRMTNPTTPLEAQNGATRAFNT